MLFVSYEFFAFLAILLVLYYTLPTKWQWPLLLIGSYGFYFASGAGNLFYIIFTTGSTWLIAGWIQRIRTEGDEWLKLHREELSREERKARKLLLKRRQGRFLALCIFLDIGLLAFVKFASGPGLGFWKLAFPMGISFYMFQSVGYVIDVYRGKCHAEGNVFRYGLFVSFFPQLVQGPISRFDELGRSLFFPHEFQWNRIRFGLQRILWGYFKKLVIADRMLSAVRTLVGDTEHYSGGFVLVGMLFYALELYADFTGGMDITIGIAQTLGITVTENFDRPYFSKNIREYWNRWHITMGTWFRDYVFYPLSVCPPMQRFGMFVRKKFGLGAGRRVPVYLSGLAVWLATGLWHGAGWNFVAWGLANYVVIMVSTELEPCYRWFHERVKVQGTFGWRLFAVVRTTLLMSCIRNFDCYQDVGLTFRMFFSMFTERNWGQIFQGSLLNLGLDAGDYGVVLVGTGVLLWVSLMQRRGSVRERIAGKNRGLQYLLWMSLLLAVLIFGNYGMGYEASQFIYNRY